MKAEYKSDYRIFCEFDDGKKGIADLESILWGPMFLPLRDRNEFTQFQISDTFHTIVWRNGADIAPEALYERAA
jgi:hypothetical protein